MTDPPASRRTLGLIALNTVPWITPGAVHHLLDRFGEPDAIFGASQESLRSVEGVTPKVAADILALDPAKAAHEELERADRLGAFFVTFDDAAYPVPLARIYAPPPVLSVMGTLPDPDQPSVAVVGTRKATTYGKAMTERFAAGLCEAGVAVVSGLARGIDGVAHRTALKAGGVTVAVLGNGLNVSYPPEHRDLQKKIAEAGGAVVSQFPILRSPDKTSFPLRNRTIVGLSAGMLVVEAGEKSGALITAYAALDENRSVWAVPGQLNNPQSIGPNRLIQKGHGKALLTLDDLLEDLPVERPAASVVMGSGGAQRDSRDPGQLTFEERTLLDHLGADERHIDAVATAAGLPLPAASAILLPLSSKG